MVHKKMQPKYKMYLCNMCDVMYMCDIKNIKWIPYLKTYAIIYTHKRNMEIKRGDIELKFKSKHIEPKLMYPIL